MASTSYLPAIEKVIKSEPLDESDDLIEPLEVFTDRSSLSGKRKRKRSISHDIDQPIPAIRVVKEEQIDPEEEFEIIPPEINRLSSSPISNSGAPSSVLRTPSLRLADRASCLISETPRLLPAVRRMKAASGPITSPVLEPANSTISGSSGPSEAETRLIDYCQRSMDHKRIVTGAVNCTVCRKNMLLWSPSIAFIHCLLHSAIQIYSCQHCFMATKTKRAMEIHVRQCHHKDAVADTDYVKDYEKHGRHIERVIDRCFRVFDLKAGDRSTEALLSVIRHCRETLSAACHSTKSPVRCNLCQCRVLYLPLEPYNDGTMAPCPFSALQHVLKHLKSNTSVPIYQCNFCDSSFQLMEHIRYHLARVHKRQDYNYADFTDMTEKYRAGIMDMIGQCYKPRKFGEVVKSTKAATPVQDAGGLASQGTTVKPAVPILKSIREKLLEKWGKKILE